MLPSIELQTSPAGLVAATAALAAGAPLFSTGLRALRLGRALRRLRESGVSDLPTGFAHVVGAVALESPLFSPLSGTPCAAFRLDVIGQEGALSKPIDEVRPFRLIEEGHVARVSPEGARLGLSEHSRRSVGPGATLSEHLTELLQNVPEALWFRRSGGQLTLVEHALVPGVLCHVIGAVRRARAAEVAAQIEVLRTGTGSVVTASATAAPLDEPDLWIDAGDHHEFLLISDHAPRRSDMTVPGWRAAGVVAGPALALLGLLYFAHVADQLRAFGRF
jgi:hypothetical protein